MEARRRSRLEEGERKEGDATKWFGFLLPPFLGKDARRDTQYGTKLAGAVDNDAKKIEGRNKERTMRKKSKEVVKTTLRVRTEEGTTTKRRGKKKRGRRGGSGDGAMEEEIAKAACA